MTTFKDIPRDLQKACVAKLGIDERRALGIYTRLRIPQELQKKISKCFMKKYEHYWHNMESKDKNLLWCLFSNKSSMYHFQEPSTMSVTQKRCWQIIEAFLYRNRDSCWSIRVGLLEREGDRMFFEANKLKNTHLEGHVLDIVFILDKWPETSFIETS